MNKTYTAIITASLVLVISANAYAANVTEIKQPAKAEPVVSASPTQAASGSKDLLSKELTNIEIEKWKQYTTTNPKDPNGFFELAMAYSRSSYIEKAWPALQEVDKLDPNFANKVIQRMTAALAKNPNDTETRYKLAFGYYFKGLKNNDNVYKQKAKDEFDKIIKQNPNHVWAMNYRAYLYTEDGELDKGIEMWEKSLAIDKNNPVTHFVLGHAYYKKGKFKQALQEIGLAFDLRNKGY
jgi:tetratricopeptide (TPR) repeat protein